MERVSIIIPTHQSRAYVPLAIQSAREYLARRDHEIIVTDDASTDGTWEWLLENREKFDLRILRTPGTEPRGLVFTFDEAVIQATCDIIWYLHPDMVFGPNCDAEIVPHLARRMMFCPTRIEPPIYPASPVVVHRDWGTTPQEFAPHLEEFLRFAVEERRGETTDGIFSPFACWKADFLSVGGHDAAFAPFYREDSDLYNRMALEGFCFRQTWSAYVYHFVGRSGRERREPGAQEKWRRVSERSDRTFIRRWGSLPNLTEQLAPIPRLRIPIALEVNMRDEVEHVVPFFAHIEPYFDEIVVVDDGSTDGSVERLRAWIDECATTESLFEPKKFQIVHRPLAGDFAGQINFGVSRTTCEWVFHADLDERFDSALLESLQDLVRSMEESGAQVCGFGRVNRLDGVVANDLPRDQWTREGIEAARARGFPGHVRNADHQFRLFHRSVRWVGRVHEKPSPCFDAPDRVRASGFGLIRHDKSLDRQAEQDGLYAGIEGEEGPSSLRPSTPRLRWLLIEGKGDIDRTGASRELARALAQSGQQVHIIASGFQPPTPGASDEFAVHPGLRDEPAAPEPATHRIQNTVFATEQMARVSDARGPFDVVHVFGAVEGLVAQSCQRVMKTLLFYTVLHDESAKWKGGGEQAEKVATYLEEMAAWVRGHADGEFVVREMLPKRGTIGENPGLAVHVIDRPVSPLGDSHTFDARLFKQRVLRLDGSTRMFTCIGPSSDQGMRAYRSALEALHPKLPGAAFVASGKIDHAPGLIRVALDDPTGRRAVFESSELVVLPEDSGEIEQVVQAMLLGVRVVAPRSVVEREGWAGNPGVVPFDPGKPDSLASAMIRPIVLAEGHPVDLSARYSWATLAGRMIEAVGRIRSARQPMERSLA